ADYLQMKAAREMFEAQLREMDAGSRDEEKWQAEAQVEECQALLEQYKRDLARFDDLKKKGNQVGDKEYDLARSSVEKQTARVKQMQNTHALVKKGPRQEKIDAMRAQVEQAKARERQAKDMLERCVIRAPVNGIVLSKRTEIGNIVNPLAMNANFNGGICEIADLTDLEVDLEVQE